MFAIFCDLLLRKYLAAKAIQGVVIYPKISYLLTSVVVVLVASFIVVVSFSYT